MSQLAVFIPRETERLSYVFDFIFSEILGISYQLITEKEFFLKFQGSKLVYNYIPIDDSLYYGCSQILFETQIFKKQMEHNSWNGIKGFFRVDVKSGVPFDLFGTAFYLLSRYDEYIAQETDPHGRVRSRDTATIKYKIQYAPVIDIYAYEIKKQLSLRYPDLVFKKRTYKYICTFDIDMAFKYKGKPLWLNWVNNFKSFILNDFKSIKEYREVKNGKLDDPFDTFEYISSVSRKYGFECLFFWLLGKRSKYDKNIPVDYLPFQQIIKKVSAENHSGIHLSYRASQNPLLFSEEINELENINGKGVTTNRFHYIRLKLPDSYYHLIENNIEADYSMGYTNRVGFRAGTCTPFLFFDLTKNKITRLKVVPFCAMDATMKYHMKLHPHEALERLKKLTDAVRSVDGEMVVVWHNNSLSEDLLWKGWRRVFEDSSAYASREII